jgi:two-component system, NarL family, sensor kinase
LHREPPTATLTGPMGAPFAATPTLRRRRRLRPPREPQAQGLSYPAVMRTPSLQRLLLQFAASGLIAVLLVALASVYVFRRAGERESVRNARRVTELIASTVIQPRLRDSIVRGDSAAIAALDKVVKPNVVRDPIVRVKIWAADGRIVYSDEQRLIGQRYQLDPEEVAAFRGGQVPAEVTDLSRPENRFERGDHKLLEVYAPVQTTSGRTLLYEDYLRFSSVSAGGRRIWSAFAPALVVGLVLLWLAQVPLAFSLARRLRGGQRERESLLLRALEASDTERRRIASDLHDGAVQHLAGTSFSLAGAAKRAGDDESRRLLQAAAASTRRAVRELRSLLVELHPPSLHGAGLEAALADLLARAPSGATTDLRIDPGVALSVEQESLVFRTAQEAVRNVATHAAASRVEVTLARDDGSYELRVTDDGAGFETAARSARRARGHLGLDLLEERARDLGATLTVESRRGEGTTLVLRGPVS